MEIKEELANLEKQISPEEKQQKSLNRRFGLVVCIGVLLLAILIYEIVSHII